ncbi:hypothetical protein CHLRE_02g092200v5 [Chlamydomonas reinhardtii]|uniref:Pyrrolo-quinoline quinone repeat domain-containing protein n=1 Tax=Chlamydomonas reinhardtii TaxID=3055 RepID=A0A2K3E1B5_CHLRE|nr:uncharacterized protein CHLRE_02g092200v5 [Chlamydomonas reinhardtii]PNW86574.1 hypothetical protein CHLRE_02g092200v5 [Chlamydomonas reinhardtii]
MRTSVQKCLLLVALVACSQGGAQADFFSSVEAVGPRLVYTAVHDNCTSVAVFNRSDGQLIWRTTDTSHRWAGTPGQRRLYSTALHGHSLQAAALSSGKPRWAFPSRNSWIPAWIHRRDSLGLVSGTVFVGPQEVEPAGAADGGGGGEADYDLSDADVAGGPGVGDGDAGSEGKSLQGRTSEAALHTLTALSSLAAARSGRLLLRARVQLESGSGAESAPPAPGSAPAAGSLVLVSTQNPGSRLYAVAEDTGRLAWQLSLDNNGDLPGANITTLLLPRELPTLALLSVAAVGDPSGGSGATPGAASGAVLAVDLANGSVRWATGALPGGAPSVALVTEGAVVLRGKADADLTQTLYGLRAATGALVWTKACSNGCTVLPVDDKMAVIASYGFSVSELEGVDLASGKVLWRGVDSTTATGLSCSGATVAHKHLFFGCPCEVEEQAAAAVEDGQEGEAAGAMQGGSGRYMSPARAAAAAVLATGADVAARPASASPSRVRSSSGAGGRTIAQPTTAAISAFTTSTSSAATVTTRLPLRKAAAKPPLCAYAVSTDTGEAAWSSRLGVRDNSSFPVASGAVGLLPLVVGDAVVIATAGWVHALDRAGGRALWSYELPAGQQLQSWDTLDEWGGVVAVRTSGVPPEDSRLLGLSLLSGELLLSTPLPPAYAPGGSPSRPYDLREGVIYVDACSGSHCCVVGVDLRQAPPPAAAAVAAAAGGRGSNGGAGAGGSRGGSGGASSGTSGGAGWLTAALHRRLQTALRGAEAEAAAAVPTTAAGGEVGKGKGPVEPSGGGASGGSGGGDGAASRSFQYCFDVEQACRASRARSVGSEIVYVLLFAQMAVLLLGFGSVVIWRACYRRSYAPYTRLNALPVLEQYEHDMASEEADESDDGGGGGDEEGEGHRGPNGYHGHGRGHGRRQLVVDPDTGIAVPVVMVEQRTPGAAGAAGAAGTGANGGCAAHAAAEEAAAAAAGGEARRVR